MTLPNSRQFSPIPDPGRSAKSKKRREDMVAALSALSNALAGGERTPIDSLLPATDPALGGGAPADLGQTSGELSGLIGDQPTTGGEIAPAELTLGQQLEEQGLEIPSGSDLRDTSGVPTHADVIAASQGLVNGRSPKDKLVTIGSNHPGNRAGILLAPAATSWEIMVRAAAADGVTLYASDTYRSWESQNSAYQKFLRGERGPGIIVAPPGTSKHGAGLAIDMTDGRGILSKGTAQWQWLSQNGASFGWYGISSEAWHWEYRGV